MEATTGVWSRPALTAWPRSVPTVAKWRAGQIAGSNRRRGDAHAVAASHQHAILGAAQIGDAHGEPDADRKHRHGEGTGRDVGQHALTEIVRLIARLLIARQVVRLGLGGVVLL